MCFRGHRALLKCLLVFIFALQGCGLQFGEKAPKRNPPSYSGQGFSCVGRIPENFEKYVQDDLSKEEIGTFISCLQKAFTTFATLTRGRSVTSYAPDEIRRFLHEFFLGDKRISDELLRELMILKQTMVGGAADAISRKELYVAIEVLEEIKGAAVELKPHLRILNPRLARHENPSTLGARLVAANEALTGVIQTFATRLQKTQNNYDLGHLQNLLTEFRSFAGWEKHFPDAIPPAHWISFLRAFRQLTVAPSDSTVVRPTDWAPLLQSFARWYLIFLQYEIGVKDQPILSGVGLQNSIQLSLEIFNLLELCASRQEGLTIRFEQMNKMVQALSDLRWIPSDIRVSSVQQALGAVVTRILSDVDATGEPRSKGLSLDGIARARSLFFRWAYIQMDIDTRLATKPRAHKIVPNVQIRPYLNTNELLKLKALSSSDLSSGWEDFFSLGAGAKKTRSVDAKKMRPLFAEDSYRVSLVREVELRPRNIQHSDHNLTMMNIWRAVTSLVFRGYAVQAGRRIDWGSGITQKELSQFYSDFRELGIDLKLVDKRNPNMSNRDFSAAKLFTYSAGGLVDEPSPKARMSMPETMELLSFLFSGGQMGQEFYDVLAKICPQGPLDLYQRPMISRSCALQRLPAIFDESLTNMPDLQQFLQMAPPQVRQAYASTLLETAFLPALSQTEWVEYNEITTLAVILHYAEAVMTTYDLNGDGVLTNPEIDMAADVFMGFIKKFAKDHLNQELSDRQAKGAFYYILTERKMPSGLQDIFLLAYVWKGSVSLNRSDLSTVFRLIISKLSDSSGKADSPAARTDSPLPPPSFVDPCQGSGTELLRNCGIPFGP